MYKIFVCRQKYKITILPYSCSPICQSPSLTCPSPDSAEGRTTPKFYTSKFSTNNSMSSSSLSSSPVAAPSPSMEIQIDLPSINTSEPTPIPLGTSDECFGDVDTKLINADDDAKNMKMPSSDNNILD